MNKIFIDFETYYDREYSLTKMTTPEYVMHDKFKVLGLSYAINDGPVLWATELPDLDWANSEVIAHNCYFDAMILTLRYGIKARRWSCTLSISRALFPYNNSHSLKAMSGYLNIGEKGDGLTLGSSDADQKLIDYAIQDTELCRGIYNRLAHFLPESEQQLLHITLRWGVEPTLVGNVEKLEASADLEAAKRDDLILRSGLSEKVLNSNKKFEAWMVEEGLEVPMKTSKTAKITWPVPALSKNDPEFHVCVAQYPELDHVWKGRIAAKSNINIVRPRTLAAVCRAIPNHGLPVPLRYAGTHTLRWCIAEGSPIHVLRDTDGIRELLEIEIQDLLITDFVWDGDYFVEHEGLAFSGYQEVMTYDGVTATKNHEVYINETTKIRISEAAERNLPIQIAGIPNPNRVHGR